MTNTIFIVDDDPTQRRILQQVISRDGYKVVAAEGGPEAYAMLQNSDFKPDVMILDLMMPQLDGFMLLDKMNAMGLHIPTIVQTAQGGIDTIVKAMQKGAKDFMVKPASTERILISIKNALETKSLHKEIIRINKTKSGRFSFGDLIAASPAMERVKQLGLKGAQSNIPILIEGESGVGKEVFARAIQGSGTRSGKPFITVNCGAIPENLVESILFGHEKGSFTGATHKQIGKFAEADTGTLFLDEVGELPLATQVKLLRAIQEGEIEPVGSSRPVKVDIRIISATNKDMIEAVKNGEFREDLYYRLNVFPINIPPLRARLEDIAELCRHFITRFAVEEGKNITGLSLQALEMMSQYTWPGNVRQLENTIFRAVILCEKNELDISDFPQIAAHVDGYISHTPAAPEPRLTADKYHQGPAMIGSPNPNNRHNGYSGGHTHIPDLMQPLVGQYDGAGQYNGQQYGAANSMPQPPHRHTAAMQPPATAGIPFLSQNGEMRRLEDIEADMIRLAMSRYRGHMSEVARKLGIGRSTLYRKVNDLGLQQNQE
ncbi:MAG: sigma-54-dependent Fis family transcriptional regulator [Rhizobiales bacterium]|nr:sigma-54 dependent transcriptional regulator [Hyphomicrobiales bacterium]NRB14199.1 sigma-54-dependent Fis family transcriptional regulator [Hyphomicrobiales bacterium]